MKRFVVATCALLAFTSSASAATLVKNGDFEITTAGTGQLGYNTVATDWFTDGYNFLFFGNTGDSVGAQGVYGGLSLWGPYYGVNNGLKASPTGGNYVAADGAFGVQPISQTINGLIAGKKYKVGFDWGGAQQSGYTGSQTEQWEVSLGNETHLTGVYQNPEAGFSGWKHEQFTFTASAPTEVLSFLARGTPSGVPPFSLLDGVTMSAAVPEPATWAMMVAGFGMLGAAMRRRTLATFTPAAG